MEKPGSEQTGMAHPSPRVAEGSASRREMLGAAAGGMAALLGAAHLPGMTHAASASPGNELEGAWISEVARPTGGPLVNL